MGLHERTGHIGLAKQVVWVRDDHRVGPSKLLGEQQRVTCPLHRLLAFELNANSRRLQLRQPVRAIGKRDLQLR